MKKALCLMMVFLIGSSSPLMADAPERVLWKKEPIPIHVQVGEERIVHFPSEVRYWLPDTLSRSLKVLSANGSLYLQSTKPFDKTRIRVQQLDDQQLYLLDVSATTAKAPTAAIHIMRKAPTHSLSPDEPTFPKKRSVVDWRVRLTRFAAQQLYAPERVQQGDRQIKFAVFPKDYSITLNEDEKFKGVRATAVGSWSADGLFVTAVVLKNLSDQKIALGFKDKSSTGFINLNAVISGRWVSISIQNNGLGKAGSPNDTTVAYFVSSRPFGESVTVPRQKLQPQNSQPQNHQLKKESARG